MIVGIGKNYPLVLFKIIALERKYAGIREIKTINSSLPFVRDIYPNATTALQINTIARKSNMPSLSFLCSLTLSSF